MLVIINSSWSNKLPSNNERNTNSLIIPKEIMFFCWGGLSTVPIIYSDNPPCLPTEICRYLPTHIICKIYIEILEYDIIIFTPTA